MHELGGHGASMGYRPNMYEHQKALQKYENAMQEWFPHYKEVYNHNSSLKPVRKTEYINSNDSHLKYLEGVDEYSARARAENIKEGGEDFAELYKYFTKESVDKLKKGVWAVAPLALTGTAAASYANQQGLGGPLVQLANKYEEGGPTEEDRVLDLSDRGYKSKEDLKITGTPPLAFAGKAASAIETLLQGNIRKDIAKKGAEYLKPVIKYAEENLHPVIGKTINYGYTALVKPIIEFGQVPEELGRASLQDTAVNMMAHELKRKKAYGGPLVDLANKTL